jgi:hypothetical protein
MKEDPNLFDGLFKRVTEFSVTYIELLKLKSINRIIKVISGIFPDFIVSTFFVLFLLFINLGLALWLGDVLGKIYLGFLIIGVFYFIVGLVTRFFFRGWIKKVTANYFIRQFFK